MKKQMLKSALIALAGVGLMSGVALAVPNDNALETQLNMRAQDKDIDIDVYNDMLSNDAYWKTTATGVSGNTLTFKLGDYNPTISFGIYDKNNISNKLEIFGTYPSSTQVKSAALSQDILNPYLFTAVVFGGSSTSATFSSTVFGYYIYVGRTSTYYYSDTDKNGDSADHMLAYQGTNEQFTLNPSATTPYYSTWTDNEYILAWEDLPNGGDFNYTDYAVMVESVEPIPEPTTMLLFGSGLLGLAAVARRSKNS